MEDNSCGWSQDPFHDKEKPLHNIQPSEEHSPGGRHIIIQVYHKGKTSEEQIQKVHHKVQTINKPQE